MEWVGGRDVEGEVGQLGVHAVIATMCRLQEQTRVGWDGTYLESILYFSIHHNHVSEMEVAN